MTAINISFEASINTGDDSKSSESSSFHPEITAEQEFCLYELETLSDSSSIGLVLRAIYDSGDVHKFTRALEKRITHYDKSILRVCTHHYQGFLDSIKQLRELKDKCAEIRKIAEETNQLAQEESRTLLKRSNEVVKYRRLQRNANTAIQQISMFLPMLDNYAQLEKLMEQKKYLQALKILEDLEHNYLNQMHKYRFTHQFVKSIGPIRDRIRERSYFELTNFLENLMKMSENIGEEARQHTENIYTNLSTDSKDIMKNDGTKELSQASDFDIILSEDGSLIKRTNGQTKNSATAAVGSRNITAKKRSSKGALDTRNLHMQKGIRINPQEKLDFGPIHQCYQIFSVLGDREKFELYYRKQRKEQIQLVIDRPIHSIESVDSFMPYLNEILGFFVIEDRIAQMQPGLVTGAHKEELWEMSLRRVTEIMNLHFGNCSNVDLMFSMKKLLLLFAFTTKNYSYNPSPFYSLLQNFRDHYNEFLIKKYTVEFNEALEKDDYSAVIVKTDEEYRTVLTEFPVNKRGIEKEPFPKKFPFSRFVPKVYSQARSFIFDCIRFMEDLQLSQSEVSDTIRRYTNNLLTKWSDELKIFVSSKKRSLIQLIQITINMGYLERSCEFLERTISEAAHNLNEECIGRGSNMSLLEDTGYLVALKNQIFRDSRSEVEQLIDDAFREKVQVFVENSNYDWELQQPIGVASEYVIDLITFLNTTFISFNNLPPVLARHICMQTCKFLADRLHSMLLSPEHKAVSMGALEQFSLDVMQCELFTAQCPVPGFEDNALAITFAHLRQLLDLVMGPDWTTFFAERDCSATAQKANPGKYSRVKASNAIILLEKVVEFEKKNSGFFTIGRGDKHKLYDTILRKLRTFSD